MANAKTTHAKDDALVDARAHEAMTQELRQAEERHRKELERALEKERLNNEILQAISKIYYAIFRIDLINDTYDEITSDKSIHHLTGEHGRASTEMIELCRSFVMPEFQSKIMEFFDISTLAARLHDEETIAEEYHAKDGNWHTARFIVKRRNEEGAVTHVLYVTRLISEEKRREQRWIASAEAAEKANRAKTDFLRRMSHDIRTPINGIMGMLEIEERHKGDLEKLEECNAKIKTSAEYLLDIVNNVLDIGKIESGDIVLEHKPFDLFELLVQNTTVVEAQAADNGISFTGGKELSNYGHRYLIGSPIHLNRLLMNIASNAVKYNRPGGSVRMWCDEVSSTKDTCVYRFICEDTGVGMNEEFQKRAFEPFSQEGKGSITTFSGSGLGLSIVKQIAEKMGGSVTFESEEGKGTTFTVTLPFEIDHDAASRSAKTE